MRMCDNSRCEFPASSWGRPCAEYAMRPNRDDRCEGWWKLAEACAEVQIASVKIVSSMSSVSITYQWQSSNRPFEPLQTAILLLRLSRDERKMRRLGAARGCGAGCAILRARCDLAVCASLDGGGAVSQSCRMEILIRKEPMSRP